MLLKLQNITDVCLPESIDTLSIITHNADILLLFGQKADQSKLQSVRILVFVNQDVFITVVIFVARLLIFSAI